MPMATDASESIYLDAYNQFDEILLSKSTKVFQKYPVLFAEYQLAL